jgi:Carboxypeptidase regulatory-like domain
MGRSFVGAGIVLISLLGLQACDAGTAGQGRRDNGTIAGLVKRGPIMPVCREGVPCDGVYAGAKVLVRTQDGDLVQRAVSNDKGAFAADVPAGAYTVSVEVDGMLPRCSPANVSVRARETVTVEVDCDTGIR